jgi:hypothetical protein
MNGGAPGEHSLAEHDYRAPHSALRLVQMIDLQSAIDLERAPTPAAFRFTTGPKMRNRNRRCDVLAENMNNSCWRCSRPYLGAGAILR